MGGRKAPEEQRREDILQAAFAVAARERLNGVTARAVAAEAGVSTGLVFFYFANKDALLVALLDWILARTLVAGEMRMYAATPSDPAAHMLAVLQRDVAQLHRQRHRVELFFDYWVLGTRHSVIRAKIRSALHRYRDAFVPLAEAVVQGDPERYAGITPMGLAAVAASFVEGCALQVVMDPAEFDVAQSTATLAALVRRRAPVYATHPFRSIV